MSEPELTNKQKIFCEHYIQCWNATEAARKAGYNGDDNTLGVIGHQNLRKPKIKDYIDQRIEENCMSTNEVLHRLSEWGRGNLSHFIPDDESKGFSLKKDNPKIGLIKKIKQHELVSKSNNEVLTRSIEIELHDAKDAVIQIGKIKGLYIDRVENSLSDYIDKLKNALQPLPETKTGD